MFCSATSSEGVPPLDENIGVLPVAVLKIAIMASVPRSMSRSVWVAPISAARVLARARVSALELVDPMHAV